MTFEYLSQYFQKLEKTQSRNLMVEILAELFKSATGREIGKICYLLQGRVVPKYEAVEFGIADKLMIRAIVKACNAKEKEVIKKFQETGDLGKAGEEIAREKQKSRIKTGIKGISVREAYETLFVIAKISGEGSQDRKIDLLAQLIMNLKPESVRYVVRIPLGKLRLGFSDMTMLDALSWMLSKDKSKREYLEDAYNVRPDIGFIAEKVKKEGLLGIKDIEAEIGIPVMPNLCQRLPSADKMVEKMGEVAVEPKYDGVRVMIHYKKTQNLILRLRSGRAGKSQKFGCEVQSYSRNLENTTLMFPELQEIGAQIDADSVILDSEAVGLDTKKGMIIPFQEIVTRKRKHDIEEARRKVPLKFFVFDILYINGQNILKKPLSYRRSILEKILKKGKVLELTPQIVTRNSQEIRAYHTKQLKMHLEGVIVKKWDHEYEPGRRDFAWVKFKEEEGKVGKLRDTIDAVVMGYSHGEGKRAAFGIGRFIVGIRKKDTFVSFTKVGTGVSDLKWKELKKAFHSLKQKKKPREYCEIEKILIPDVWVRPEIVVEIAGDNLSRSPTHSSGYALRFPRLVRVREDKSPWDATTVEEVQSMYKQQ